MSNSWPIFVTAPNVSAKAMNTLLLRMLDFGGNYCVDSPWLVVRDTKMEHEFFEPTQPPVDSELLAHNDFAGYSLEAIDAWMRDEANRAKFEDDEYERQISTSQCLIVDAKGLATGTAVVLDTDVRRKYDEPSVDKFAAVRVPYEQAPGVMANIELANLFLTEFHEYGAEPDEDGVHSMHESSLRNNGHDGSEERREELARQLREDDLLEDLPFYRFS